MKLLLSGATTIELYEIDQAHFHLEGDADGEGYGPLQMFATSLALCTVSVLVHYAEHVLEVGVSSLRITVRWSYAERPLRVDNIDMQINWPELPQDRMEAAERAAASCTIHHTLERPPTVRTTVNRV
jgi:uncharacterized OsmC-like protein